MQLEKSIKQIVMSTFSGYTKTIIIIVHLNYNL